MSTEADDENCIVVDFFAGSGTTAHAVWQQNIADSGKRKFILVQLPQSIDAKTQKDAHHFVTDTLGKPEATIFEITAERLRRAGAKLEAELAARAVPEGEAPPTLDTGFRVFELVDDPDALFLAKPMQDVTQDDLRTLQAAIATPQPALLPRVLHNLLLDEGLPLTTAVQPVVEGRLYLAGTTLLVLDALDLGALTDHMNAQKAEGRAAQQVSVFAPWVTDDNFLWGLKAALAAAGLPEDRLRLRG